MGGFPRRVGLALQFADALLLINGVARIPPFLLGLFVLLAKFLKPLFEGAASVHRCKKAVPLGLGKGLHPFGPFVREIGGLDLDKDTDRRLC